MRAQVPPWLLIGDRDLRGTTAPGQEVLETPSGWRNGALLLLLEHPEWNDDPGPALGLAIGRALLPASARAMRIHRRAHERTQQQDIGIASCLCAPVDRQQAVEPGPVGPCGGHAPGLVLCQLAPSEGGRGRWWLRVAREDGPRVGPPAATWAGGMPPLGPAGYRDEGRGRKLLRKARLRGLLEAEAGHGACQRGPAASDGPSPEGYPPVRRMRADPAFRRRRPARRARGSHAGSGGTPRAQMPS